MCVVRFSLLNLFFSHFFLCFFRAKVSETMEERAKPVPRRMMMMMMMMVMVHTLAKTLV